MACLLYRRLTAALTLLSFVIALSVVLPLTNGKDDSDDDDSSIYDSNRGPDYGLVIDAGSSHSSLFIFSWPQRRSKNSTAPYTKPSQLQVSPTYRPGVSTCCNSQSDMNRYLEEIVDWAYSYLANCESGYPCLSDNTISRIPLFLKATAGMRVLPDSDRVMILQWIRTALDSPSVNPFFYFQDGYAVIISGEEESFFGWLSVNLLSGLLTPGSTTITSSSVSDVYPSVGSMDMGGQSCEMSFEVDPSGDILEEFSTVHLWGKSHRLFTHSFLTYGLDGFEQKVAQLSYDDSQTDDDKSGNNNEEEMSDYSEYSVVSNPCLYDGYTTLYNVTVDETDEEAIVILVNETGTAMAGRCPQFVKRLFYNDSECLTGQCSILGVYQPTIPENMTFFAFSGYAYVIEELGLPIQQSPNDLVAVASDICSMDYEEFLNSSYGQSMINTGNEQYAYSTCLAMTFISELLLAYGFDPNSENILFTDDINNYQLGWTLGSMLRDVNWMNFELYDEDDEDDNDGLSDADKAYRAATWSLLSLVIAGMVCLCLVFVKHKYDERVQGYTRFNV